MMDMPTLILKILYVIIAIVVGLSKFMCIWIAHASFLSKGQGIQIGLKKPFSGCGGVSFCFSYTRHIEREGIRTQNLECRVIAF